MEVGQVIYSKNIGSTKYWSQATIVEILSNVVCIEFPNSTLAWITKREFKQKWASSQEEIL